MPNCSRASRPGHNVLNRLGAIAALSRDTPAPTRPYLSAAHRAVAELIMQWMRALQMTVWIDPAGTVIGRIEGAHAKAKTLLLGSHIDTPTNPVGVDGCLGIALALEALENLGLCRHRLPFAVEIMAFGADQGLRFSQTFPGARAVAGRFNPSALHEADQHGTSLRGALQRFGGNPHAIGAAAYDGVTLLGYIEINAEQGSILRQEGLPVGVVTTICGASRYDFKVAGAAGQATTTTTTSQRRDALAAAAEMVLAVERASGKTKGLVAVADSMVAAPHTAGTLPIETTFTLDVRSAVDRTRRAGLRHIERELRAIAAKRQVRLTSQKTYDENAAGCDPGLIRRLSGAIAQRGLPAIYLPSSAGHDASVMTSLCPVGMLSLRCQDSAGNGRELMVSADDIEIAVGVLSDFLACTAPCGRGIGLSAADTDRPRQLIVRNN